MVFALLVGRSTKTWKDKLKELMANAFSLMEDKAKECKAEFSVVCMHTRALYHVGIGQCIQSHKLLDDRAETALSGGVMGACSCAVVLYAARENIG